MYPFVLKTICLCETLYDFVERGPYIGYGNIESKRNKHEKSAFRQAANRNYDIIVLFYCIIIRQKEYTLLTHIHPPSCGKKAI